MENYTNLMVDLETLGTAPGCVIMSIGAVGFNSNGVSSETFYAEINTADAMSSGALFIDESTKAWWDKQEDRDILTRCEQGGMKLITAVMAFNQFAASVCGEGFTVWGNGASFDEPILREAMKSVGVDPSWKYWSSMCFRTLNFLGHKAGVPLGSKNATKHNALSDAIHQAERAVSVLSALGVKL